MLDRLLDLCGYSPERIERERSRVQKAFGKASIHDEDVRRGVERIETYFDVELQGVRKFLGLYLTELVDLILSREEKRRVLYSMLPSLGGNPLAAVNVATDDCYAGFPDICVTFFFGQVLGKLGYILDAAEQHALPAGCAHCGSNQIRLGRYLLDLTPKPDLHLSWGVLCDEAPKLDDMLSTSLHIPTVFINRAQDGWIVKDGIPQLPDRTIQYVAQDIQRAVERIQEVVGVTITRDMMATSLAKTLGYFLLYCDLGALKRNDPIPISEVSFSLTNGFIVTNTQRHEDLMDAAQTLLQELRGRVERGVGALPKGTPKVLIAGATSACNPGVTRLIEDLGIGICVNELQIYSPNGQPFPQVGDIDDLATEDPYVVMAKLFATNSSFMGIGPRIHIVEKACRYWDVDGVLWWIHANCRTYATDAMIIKDAIEKRTGLPVAVIEGDVYDPRSYTVEQQRTRFETFAEMVKVSKLKRDRGKRGQ